MAFLLFSAAAITLGQSGYWSGPFSAGLFSTASWVLTGVFVARVIGDFRWARVFKKELSTDFAKWDTQLFVSLCAVLALGCAIMVLGGGPTKSL